MSSPNRPATDPLAVALGTIIEKDYDGALWVPVAFRLAAEARRYFEERLSRDAVASENEAAIRDAFNYAGRNWPENRFWLEWRVKYAAAIHRAIARADQAGGT